MEKELREQIGQILRKYAPDAMDHIKLIRSKRADYQIAVFALARRLKRNVAELTREIKAALNQLPGIRVS